MYGPKGGVCRTAQPLRGLVIRVSPVTTARPAQSPRASAHHPHTLCRLPCAGGVSETPNCGMPARAVCRAQRLPARPRPPAAAAPAHGPRIQALPGPHSPRCSAAAAHSPLPQQPPPSPSASPPPRLTASSAARAAPPMDSAATHSSASPTCTPTPVCVCVCVCARARASACMRVSMCALLQLLLLQLVVPAQAASARLCASQPVATADKRTREATPSANQPVVPRVAIRVPISLFP